MQDMTHQMMGYDRTSTMFSPDGRLLQVEYAKEAVKQGSTAIGMVCKDGVLLVADKRVVDKLIVPESVEKIFQVDEHIGATATGFVMDGRVLIERAQVMAQQHNVTYGVPIEVATLVKEVCDIKQFYTQYGGARPFGVSILFAGIDDEAKLFMTDPTGIFFEFKATAIGEYEQEIKDLLVKQYKESLTIEDGLKVAVGILKKVLGKDFDAKRLDGVYITNEEKKFTRIENKKLRM
ncbi:archaeal proteasome endopeptidase complex subunit alpha [Candidatus Woesearchaeota archaeon]|nr:MAG: archaeal proteasome endopeptidase complex subunit alpha [Candidatus Woesearchaeota archaeon]